MRTLIGRFRRDQNGATSIEYAMIAGLIFVVIVASVQLFASRTSAVFAKVSAAVSTVVP